MAVPCHEGANSLITGVISVTTVVSESHNRCRVMLKVRPLCTGAESNLRDRVLGEVEKNSFIALPGKGGHSGSCPKQLCPWDGTWEDLMGSFIATVQGWGC